MAILVIQLARFGDIFQSRPALNALRRQFPGEQVHLLVRERFKDAAIIPGVIVHALPTAAILASLFDGRGDDAAVKRLEEFVAQLKSLQFSRVINLSFSPFSSYLTDALAQDGASVSGYTRHADGYLKIPDDSSAYFYAQAGVGRHNRYHVTEVFAAVAGVEFVESDFALEASPGPKNSSVIIHLGASQAVKAYPPELWREVLIRLQGRVGPLILVGSASERAMADAAAHGLDATQVENRVGESTMSELMEWVSQAQLVIGADSAPVHIAALTATPVLNLSCDAVNFWETGPFSAGSRILKAGLIHEISPDAVADGAIAMIENRNGAAFATRATLLGGYQLCERTEDFYWPLIQALYTANDYPPLPSGASSLGFQRLFDIAELAVEQLSRVKLDGRIQPDWILASVDDMLVQLPLLEPLVEPVVAWFQTERLRMGPASADEVLKKTMSLFEQLGWIAAVYHRPEPVQELGSRALELAEICAPHFREFDTTAANPIFQELLSVLQDLSRHATKVGTWSSVLKGLTRALEEGDLIELADTLEFDLPQWIAMIQTNDNIMAWNPAKQFSY